MVEVVPGGGSLSLAELVDEHGSWLAADFLSEYGLRLADVLFEWSPREVLGLVEVLPPEGRFWAHMSGGEQWRQHLGWGKDRHLFADLMDVYVRSHSSDKKPWTYPRPGSEKKQQQGTPLMAMIPRRTPKGD